MIPGSDANALCASLPNSCDRAFNLFFIHSLAPPFLSLVVVLCDVGVNVVLGPPSRASIRTPRVIPKAVKIEMMVIPCSNRNDGSLFLKKGPYSLTKCPSFFIQELHD